MDRPEERFEPYGPAVVAEIRHQIRRSATLGPLLRQIGLPAPRTIREQCEVLLAYLEEYGSIHFLNEVSATDPVNKGRVSLQRRRAPGEGMPPGERTPPGGMSAYSRVRPSGGAESFGPVRPGGASGPGSPAGAPEAAAAAGRGTEEGTGRKWIDTPAYRGPDRRSGEDRRQGPRDRRQSLETVYTNHRYGGWDRRKTARRAEDREKPGGK